MSKCENCLNYQCDRETEVSNEACDIKLHEVITVDALQEDYEKYVCFV